MFRGESGIFCHTVFSDIRLITMCALHHKKNRYPLLFVGTRDGTLDLMKIPEEKRTASLLNQTTFALLSITTALAWKLTDLSFIASISGAVFGTALIFVYPTLMFRGAIKNLGDKATDGQKREGKFAMIVNLLGITIAAIGTKMSLAGVGAH